MFIIHIHIHISRYAVLYSTGPDCVTESAFGVRDEGFDGRAFAYLGLGASMGGGAGRKIRGGGVRGGGGKSGTSGKSLGTGMITATVPGGDRVQERGTGVTDEGTLIADPGPFLFNANTFSWRGAGNPALTAHPT